MNFKNLIKLLSVMAALLWSAHSAMAQTSGGSQTVTGSLDSRDYSLTVTSARGQTSAVPSVGPHSTYCWQSSVSCSVNATVQDGGATYNCTGWTGTGSVPATGSGHITPTFLLTQPVSTITWQWQQEITYTLTVNRGSGDGTYPVGELVTITADAAPAGQEFAAWTGDVSSVADASSATTVVTMPARNIQLTATYRDLVAPDPFGTPSVYPTLPMTILASVTLFDAPAADDDVLAVFHGNELRGKAKIVVVEGQALSNVTVYTPSDDEVLTFKVWDHSEEEVFVSSATAPSAMGGQLGSYPDNLFPVPVSADPFGPVVVYPTTPMQIVGSVELFGSQAADGDFVAVFSGGELRGKSEVVVVGGIAMVNLSVFTARDGEELEFRVWDESADLTHLSRFSKATSQVGGVLGSYPDDLFPIVVTDDIELTLDLVAGWSQISYNLGVPDRAPQVLFSPISAQIERVVSMDHGTYIPTLPSSLNTLKQTQLGKGYWINMKTAQTLVLRGDPLVLANQPVVLATGWNHIGYLPETGGRIRDVMSGALSQGRILRVTGIDGVFDPASPDIFNSMTTMHPGRGYWVKASAPCTFYYTAPPSAIQAMVWSGADPFGNVVQYPNPQMSVIAKVTLGGVPTAAGNVIAAFVGNELRAKVQTADYQGNAFAVLAVQIKQNGETVSFRLWDRATDRVFTCPSSATTEAGGAPYPYSTPLLLQYVSAGAQTFSDWALALPTGQRGYVDNPAKDGVNNLLKYAFNMNPGQPDVATLIPGSGTSGLPAITTQVSGSSGIFRFEFVRRVGSGLTYAPRKSSSMSAASWVPLTDSPTVLPINADWERVIYEEPFNPGTTPKCFGRVEVSTP